MSTLAQILFDLGNEVSGYDDARGHKFTQDGLEERGIQIFYDRDHEIDKDTIVTYSVAFKEDHKEMKRVIKRLKQKITPQNTRLEKQFLIIKDKVQIYIFFA